MPGDAMTSRSFLRLLSPYRIVAYLEIAGGIIGLHLSAMQVVSIGLTKLTAVTATPLAAFALLSCLSIAAGLQLIKRSKTGYTLSIIVQSFYVPVIYSDYLFYKIYVLFRIIVFVQFPKIGNFDILFGYDFNILDVGFRFFIDNSLDALALGVNLAPIVFIATLCVSWRMHGRRHAPQVDPGADLIRPAPFQRAPGGLTDPGLENTDRRVEG
jgi:hypothetical protein